jgi:aspartate/methionine/tyrosine aminotransferase
MELRLLDEVGIATIAGTSFGQYGEGHLRVSYANSLDNIAAAMDRMGDWLKKAAA